MNAVGRPELPSGYGIDAGSEGRLPWSWVVERLTAARNYWIVTTRPDGRPHAMPVWGLWLDEAVFFSTDPTSFKARNIAARPDVIVHLESGDDVIVIDGRTDQVAGSDLPATFVAAYDAKYGHQLDTSDPQFGFYRVTPSRVLAWREADFPSSATRFSN
jgi:pyridoxine/pyridoxamine 5'-phosphate oxidase